MSGRVLAPDQWPPDDGVRVGDIHLIVNESNWRYMAEQVDRFVLNHPMLPTATVIVARAHPDPYHELRPHVDAYRARRERLCSCCRWSWRRPSECRSYRPPRDNRQVFIGALILIMSLLPVLVAVRLWYGR